MKGVKIKNSCRCCKSKKLIKYLNLGLQPLANSYHKNEKLPRYELAVNLCTNCFNSQLSVVVDPDSMFKNYLYVSGTTKTFRDHTKKLAANAVRRFSRKNLTVLDIACNDGTQLEHFRQLGCRVVGVDPAENLRIITKRKNIPVEVDYWRPKLAEKYKDSIDIMTGTNVFAHVNDLDEFLTACKIALKEDGVLILEFPYADKMIEYNEFDTVYHEHLSYFLVNSFNTLVRRLGFYIDDVLQTKIHGGSIRFFIKKGGIQNTTKVDRLIREEKAKGLLDVVTYKKFSARVKKNKKDMKELMLKLSKNNCKVIGYGASAKGNTMLNYFKIKPDYIVDDNKLKWGYKTPGMNIPIVSPSEIAKEKGQLYIIVLSWNFFNEIAKKVQKIALNNDSIKLITYVPNINIYHIKKVITYEISA